MSNKMKDLFKHANINYKKELIMLAIINDFLIAAMIVVYLFTRNRLLFIPFIFIIVLVNAITFYRYLSLYNKNVTSQIKEFTSLFRYLYLDINNQIKVKDALIKLKEQASLTMNKKIETLLEEIKRDSSFTPYLNFASTFSSVLIEEVMLNLYRYNKHSQNDNLLHFNEAFYKLKKVVDDDEDKNSDRQYEFIKNTAIIGTAIIVMLVIIVTIIIVEEYIHG